MKRIGIFAVVILALVATLSTTALAAKPATGFVARANHAEQGGTLHVMASVRHADRAASFSASATVAFSTGPVTVDLKRHGKSFTAGAGVPVPADAAIGPVAVVVTITYGGTPTAIPAQGVIQPLDPS
jgi:hypothetical protein